MADALFAARERGAVRSAAPGRGAETDRVFEVLPRRATG